MAQVKPKSTALAETKRVGKFGIVGILNTLIDFAIYNLGISLLRLPVIGANLISTTVAMSFSFIANKTFVFGSKDRRVFSQAVAFVTITAIGLYVIQNGVIFILKYRWSWPLDTGYNIVKAIGLDSLNRDFVINNGAKAIGTLFSLTWNYLLYKKVVFTR